MNKDMLFDFIESQMRLLDFSSLHYVGLEQDVGPKQFHIDTKKEDGHAGLCLFKTLNGAIYLLEWDINVKDWRTNTRVRSMHDIKSLPWKIDGNHVSVYRR